jgi:hypothetical protein
MRVILSPSGGIAFLLEAVLRRLDYAAIFLLIAGTYSPFLVGATSQSARLDTHDPRGVDEASSAMNRIVVRPPAI